MRTDRAMRGVLIALLLLVGGCSAASKQTPAPASPKPGAPNTASLSREERLRLYDDLRSRTMGIPYVVTWDFDERQDKPVIGVGTREAKQRVQAEMAKLELPESAVVISHPQQLLSEAAPFGGCQVGSITSAGEGGGLSVPERMTPGQEFLLTVTLDAKPEEITRGVDSYLDCWDGSAWSTRFILLVGYGSPNARPTARIFGVNIIDSLGLTGSVPETLVLPDNIPPGRYRIHKSVYAGTAQHNLSAYFEVPSES